LNLSLFITKEYHRRFIAMAHFVTFDDGEMIDTDTAEGAYRHVGRFLRQHGAGSDVFASLGKLFPKLRVSGDGPMTDTGRESGPSFR
jgi:hypothetical protein